MKSKKAKPFVKWVGGKGGLLAQLQAYFPENFNTYFEPFLGGGAVFYDLQPQKSVINDINTNLIGAYKLIKNDPDKLIKYLADMQDEYLALGEEERKAYFYRIRDKYNELEPSFEKSALLLFMNKTCFNGMYRENSKGEFNVPAGRYQNPTIVDKENIMAVSELLQGTTILSTSFERAVKEASKGDFVYFDPPYHPLNETSSFTSYSEGDFTSKDQIALAETFKKLDSKGCYVMLSNSNTDFIKELYKDYSVNNVMAGRSINSKATKRGKIKEVVVVNY